MVDRRWIRDERGVALITVLVITLITTGIGIALVGLMNTDLTHAGIQHAKARSFEAAQAGLETARDVVTDAPDPVAFATAPGGVPGTLCPATGTCSDFTYWVDAGPATTCPPGLKTLEAEGQVNYLGFTIRSRVQACGVPGPAFPTALFGVSLIEAQGATSRTYIAPFSVGRPGAPRGANIGSFREINFNDTGLRINALSETGTDFVTVRDPAGPGTITIEDYRLFGFTTRPTYETNPSVEALPWILMALGDIVKGQPTTGPLANRCDPPTPFACVTVSNSPSDVTSMYELRHDENMRHAYMNRMSQMILPRLCDPLLPVSQRIGCLNPEDFRIQATNNTANAAINTAAGLPGKTDSAYSPTELDLVVTYLARNPGQSLRGTVYVDGTYTFRPVVALDGITMITTVDLGGTTGDVTLGVRGDLVLETNFSLTNRHDIYNTDPFAAAAARRRAGILVFGLAAPLEGRQPNVCMGERPNGSGRLIMCGGSGQGLTADGLLFTADGVFIGSQASIDLVGGMYNDNRGTSNPSYSNENSTVVVRFDPLAFGVFPGGGLYIISWQQLR